VCPQHTQLPSNRRLASLVKAGIINAKNCPRLVPLAFPENDDPGWEFVNPKHLADMAFPFITSDYLSGFTSKWGSMSKKGTGCFWQGRAYSFRWNDKGEHRFFRFRTKRTMKYGAMVIHISFDRDSDGEWRYV
jgi:hypothetical protein